ncbi:MAG: uroporphyrinogen decarboxylase family protein, partial [Spirochaetota bacterium]
MTSREIVVSALNGLLPDRIPLSVYAGWREGIKSKIIQEYGSLINFMRKFNLDIVTGIFPRFPFGDLRGSNNRWTVGDYLHMNMIDPCSPGMLTHVWSNNLFLNVAEALKYHNSDIAVFAHVWGVFELLQFLFEKTDSSGIEDALVSMISERQSTGLLFKRLAEWSAGCVENAARAGVDAIELSDDWGQQNTMLFSPELWRELIFPATKIIVDAAKKNNLPVILHSDGDITMVLPGVKKLGFNGLHPVQESAGMSFEKARKILGESFCIMGGLDVVSVAGMASLYEVKTEVQRVFAI